MADNQQNNPNNDNSHQIVINALNGLNMNEDILIKAETLDSDSLEDLINGSAAEYTRLITSYDTIVLNSMTHSRAIKNSMAQPNGISGINAKSMVGASKGFVANMNRILDQAKIYESTMNIAPNYDLQNEANICSLDARMIRQTMEQIKLLEDAVARYQYSSSDATGRFCKEYKATRNLLADLRAHAKNRYPNYINYNIV